MKMTKGQSSAFRSVLVVGLLALPCCTMLLGIDKDYELAGTQSDADIDRDASGSDGSDPGTTDGGDGGDDGGSNGDKDGAPNDAAPTCFEAGDRFADDFEGRDDLLGCWTTRTNPTFDASVGLADVPDAGRAFRIVIPGTGSGATASLTRELAVKTPARIRFRFRIDLPDLGGPKNGFTAFRVTYRTGDAGNAPAIPLLIGAPDGDHLSAFLTPAATPAVTNLVSADWHAARLDVDAAQIALFVDEKPCGPAAALPTPPVAVTEIELGLSAGSIQSTYEAIYDEVSVDPL